MPSVNDCGVGDDSGILLYIGEARRLARIVSIQHGIAKATGDQEEDAEQQRDPGGR